MLLNQYMKTVVILTSINYKYWHILYFVVGLWNLAYIFTYSTSLSLDSTSGVFSSHMWRWLLLDICWLATWEAILRALDFTEMLESYWKIFRTEMRWNLTHTILRITLTMVLKDRRVETTAISMWDMIVAEVITVETLGGVCILDLFWK